MFNRTVRIIENQGERILKLEEEKQNYKDGNIYLNKKCLDLQGQVDDLIDERKIDLKLIAECLTMNDYGNPKVKIAKALEFIEDKIKELDNAESID